MKDYNYDFVNYTGMLPNRGYQVDMMSNYMTGNVTNNMNYDSAKNTSGMNLGNKDQTIDPYQACLRGNSFANLYDPYKNYRPGEINPSSEREAMLNQWQQYNFILTDLDLYLDTHPNDSEAIALYNKYLDIKEQIGKKYERTYGPLTLSGDNLGRNDWKWINSPWPWEGVK